VTIPPEVVVAAGTVIIILIATLYNNLKKVIDSILITLKENHQSTTDANDKLEERLRTVEQNKMSTAQCELNRVNGACQVMILKTLISADNKIAQANEQYRFVHKIEKQNIKEKE
jgi:hypothetical protein